MRSSLPPTLRNDQQPLSCCGQSKWPDREYHLPLRRRGEPGTSRPGPPSALKSFFQLPTHLLEVGMIHFDSWTIDAGQQEPLNLLITDRRACYVSDDHGLNIFLDLVEATLHRSGLKFGLKVVREIDL